MPTVKKPKGWISSYDYDAPIPTIGSKWTWNRGSYHEVVIEVIEVRWNSEEWWVRSIDVSPSGNKPYWHDLSVFWESVSTLRKSDLSPYRHPILDVVKNLFSKKKADERHRF